jgi:hypothetical protein
MQMTTNDPGPDSHQEPPDEQQMAATQAAALRRPVFPAIRWGAVLAGVAVGVSVQLALALLGIATGLSAVDITEGDNPDVTSPLVWAGVSMLIAAFVGGYVSARMSGLKRKADGVLHGAVTWAVTTLLFATLATSVTGSMISRVFNSANPVARSAITQGVDSPLMATLSREIGADADLASLRRLQREIQAGRRDEAINSLTDMGVEQARAAGIVDQALIAAGAADRASPQARQSADAALAEASRAAWGVFLAVALSLGFGIFGGRLGAAGCRRASWHGPGMAHA